MGSKKPLSMERKSLANVVVLSAITILCFGVFWVAGGNVMVSDRLSGKLLQFDSPVVSTSPNGKIRFSADRDGMLRLIDVRTNSVLWQRSGVANEYKAVSSVMWPDNQRALVILAIRYPLLTNWQTYLWDSTNGTWQKQYITPNFLAPSPSPSPGKAPGLATPKTATPPQKGPSSVNSKTAPGPGPHQTAVQ